MVSAARAAKLLGLGAVLVSATLWTGAAKAGLITDDFKFTLAGSTVASGSFSYDSSLSGTSLGYGNLASFNITVPSASASYDLNYATTTADTYQYFDFNTLTNAFVSAAVTGAQGTFNELLGAAVGTSASLTSGFFVAPIPPSPSFVETFPFQVVGYDTVTVSSAVPEPSTLALLGAAIAAFGFLLRRKRVPEALLVTEPEPSTLAFLGATVAAFGFLLRRKRIAEASYAAELEAL